MPRTLKFAPAPCETIEVSIKEPFLHFFERTVDKYFITSQDPSGLETFLGFHKFEGRDRIIILPKSNKTCRYPHHSHPSHCSYCGSVNLCGPFQVICSNDNCPNCDKSQCQICYKIRYLCNC